jgi:hypothetical protein
MDMKGARLRRDLGEVGGGKGKDMEGKRTKICHIHTFKNKLMKSTKLSKKGVRIKENENVVEDVSLFKVHCTHVRNYHSETPMYY